MKKIKKSYLIITLTLIFFVILAIIGSKNNNVSTGFISESQTISNLSSENIYINNKDIFAYDDSLVKLVNSDQIVWQDSLNFKNSFAVFNEGILGIGEKNGNKLNVYSNAGLLYEINLDSNILSFSLNKNGYSSIISKMNNYYEINVFNSSGVLILGLKNISYTEGIPVSSAISDNNKFLTVSFLKIDDINYNSTISLYSLENSQSDSENSDNLSAAFLQENQFSGIVEFVGNSHILTVSEKQVTFFKIVNNTFSRTFWEIDLNNKLKFVKILDSSIFVLVYGEPTNFENYFENNTVVFYNISGKKLGQYTSEKDITNISVGYDSCIIQCNRTLTAISNKGKILWEYQIIQDLNQFYFFENTNKIIVSSNNNVNLIEINKKSNITNQEEAIFTETSEDTESLDDTTSEDLIEDTENLEEISEEGST